MNDIGIENPPSETQLIPVTDTTTDTQKILEDSQNWKSAQVLVCVLFIIYLSGNWTDIIYKIQQVCVRIRPLNTTNTNNDRPANVVAHAIDEHVNARIKITLVLII